MLHMQLMSKNFKRQALWVLGKWLWIKAYLFYLYTDFTCVLSYANVMFTTHVNFGGSLLGDKPYRCCICTFE